MRLAWLVILISCMPVSWARQATSSDTQEPTQTPPQQSQPADSEPGDISPGDLPPPDYTPYQPSSEPPPEIDTADLYINTFGSLLFVLALIGILAWAARRFLFNRLGVVPTAKARMSVVQNLPLGTRRHVSLIEVDGKRFLLGVTDHQVNLIKALDDLDFDQALNDAGTTPPPTVSQLMQEES